MTTKKNVRRIVVQAALGAVVIALLTGGTCSSPSQSEVNQIANEEASKRACGSIDINTVAKNLTAEAKKSTCWSGFEENQTAAICNAKDPSTTASWVCAECTAPSCESEPSQCGICGATVSTKVNINMTVNVKGVNVVVKGEVSYAATVNFQNIIAKVRGTPEKTGTQPAFDYWYATTDVTSTRNASLSGELTASGDFTGGISLSTGFECSVGVNFRGGKSAHQGEDTCPKCKPPGTSSLAEYEDLEECEPDPDPDPTPDAGIPDGGYPYPDSGYPDGGYPYPDSGYPYPDSGYPSPDGGYPYPDSGYPYPDSGYPSTDGGYPYPDSGYPSPDAGYPYPDSGGYPYPDSGYPSSDSGYPSPDAWVPGDATSDAWVPSPDAMPYPYDGGGLRAR